MDQQPHGGVAADGRARAALELTRQGVADRLADPYLTEHDRWVLRQFASFLGGVAPNPDWRARRTRPASLLQDRATRTRVWSSAPEIVR
jgi:hypothetical protein